MVSLPKLPKAYFTLLPSPVWPEAKLLVNGEVPSETYLEKMLEALTKRADKHNIFVDYSIGEQDGVYTVTLKFDRVTVYDERVRFLAFGVVRFLVEETRGRMTV